MNNIQPQLGVVPDFLVWGSKRRATEFRRRRKTPGKDAKFRVKYKKDEDNEISASPILEVVRWEQRFSQEGVNASSCAPLAAPLAMV